MKPSSDKATNQLNCIEKPGVKIIVIRSCRLYSPRILGNLDDEKIG